jgi:hydrogenase nickel incorporation protein HypB
MFEKADLVLITKTDLLPHLDDVSLPAIGDALSRVMPRLRYIPISVKTGEGIDRWIDWLECHARTIEVTGDVRVDVHR